MVHQKFDTIKNLLQDLSTNNRKTFGNIEGNQKLQEEGITKFYTAQANSFVAKLNAITKTINDSSLATLSKIGTLKGNLEQPLAALNESIRRLQSDL